jgi:OmpA-OmpF porin, OOP family
MKNSCTLLVTAVMAFLIVCFCASGALAENREGAINITPFIGGFNTDPDLAFENGPAFGIGLGYNFSEKLGAEFTFHYAKTDYNGNIKINRNEVDFGDENGKTLIYKLDLLYHLTGLLPGDMIVPYLAAGPGMITWDSDAKGVDKNNDFLLNYGGGLKIFLTRNVALRGDVRNIINFDKGFDDRYSNLLYTVGLTYEIGGKEREEVKEEAPAPEPEAAPAPAPAVVPEPAPVAPAAKEQGAIIFRNINFDFNKSNIKSESYPILDEVTEYLKANPNVKMEVQGHTDSKGTAAYNLKLSDRRAAAVKTYLVGKGVAADRLETKGYGLSKPIAPNDTEENRARNRRVEFKPI